MRQVVVCFLLQLIEGRLTGVILADRSIHDIRIEHLWVDVTAQVGAKWSSFFTELEVQHGLDINNSTHLWILHQVFLPKINYDLAIFSESWNHHKIQMCTGSGPSCSPIDMFGFDMLACGVCGDALPDLITGAGGDSVLGEAELGLYGVDWGALQDVALPGGPGDVDHTSWVG